MQPSRAIALLFALVLGLPGLAQERGPLPDLDRSWWMRRAMEPAWALANVHVVDVRSGTVRSDATIVVCGDRIESVGAAPLEWGADVVDGGGGFVIPGLFDLHAHVIPGLPGFPATKPVDEAMADLLHAGVTAIRLLPLTSEAAQTLRARVASGELPGPTVVPGSGLFEKEPQRTSRGFDDPVTAVEWVRKEALVGTRWIKVYSSMDEASLAAIVDAARAYGMKVGGHATGVPPWEAVGLGQLTLEHTIDWPASCQRAGREAQAGPMIARAAGNWAGYDEARGTALMERMKERGAAWVPTLVISERVLELGGHDGRPMDDEQVLERFGAGLDLAAREAVRMHRMGGLVGLGTDFPVDGILPGSSAHDELELFVERGGATPLEALRIGTLSSARILGLAELLGTVESGKLASFVVLEANPLEDVANVRRVRLVVHDGRRYAD